MSFTINGVYIPEAGLSDTELNFIAIRPTINLKRNRIEWEDTSQGTWFKYINVNFDSLSYDDIKKGSIPQKISIITEDSKIINLVFASKIYEEVIKSKFVNQKNFQGFENDQELQNYFLNNSFFI